MNSAIRWSLLAVCLLSPVRITAAEDSAKEIDANDNDATSTLIWGNGDSLFGHIHSAKGDTLVWDSPLFADPLALDIDVLSVVRFPEAPDASTEEADDFRITLMDNSILTGSLKQITADTAVFESTRHGEIHVRKSALRSLHAISNSGLTFLGPRGLDGWTTNKSTEFSRDLKEEDDGSLTAPNGDIKFSRKLKLPPKCELFFKVTSDKRPDFSISIGGPKGISTKRPRLEMWSDMFVLGAGSRFVPLQSVESSQRELSFRLFIDFPASTATVFDATGRKLGTITSEKWEPTEGILIEAINTRLTLKTLYVSAWDGTPPSILPEGVSGISLTTGKTVSGELVGYAADSRTLQVRTDGETDAADADAADGQVAISVDEIREIRLSAEAVSSPGEGETLIAWTNGGFLSGTLVSVTDTAITLKTPHTIQPVTSQLSAVRHIRLPNTQQATAEPDRLFFEGGSLGGSLTMEDSDTPIRWKPVGGQNATTLVSRGDARFQRGEKPDQLPIDTERFPDIVHLKAGDVIPGRVESWTDEQLRLTSPVSDVRQLPGNLVKAIELGVASSPSDVKFDAPGWKRIRGKVNITKNGRAVGFRQNSTFRESSFGQNETLDFHMSWTKRTYGLLYFNLFGGSDGKGATSVGIMIQPGRLVCSSNPNQQQMQMQLFGGGREADQQPGLVKLPNNEADVQITSINGEVVVSINGAETARMEATTTSAKATGLEIASGVSYMQTNSGFQNNQVGDLVTISNMSARPVSGATLRNFVGEEARERSLTIPRFRRDNPQTHVLIAPNGDILRGRLKEISAGEVVFESRLETFRFPTARIAAVVRVDDDDEASQSLPERIETAVQAKLDNGYILTMTPERMQNGEIIGESSILGNCRIPARAIRDLFLGQAEGREEILSYVKWIRQDAVEPEWEMPEEGEEANSLTGQVVDDFELPTLDGGTFRLSDHQDKVVILDFWATWCGPCAAALPEYIAAAKEFDESQVIFVAVNLEETKDRINEFLTQRNLAPVVAMDRGSVVARKFGVSGIPHSVILGPGRIVQHVTVGFKPGIRDTTRQRVQDILENPPAL